MGYEENRWLQRFQNYQRALYHLDAAVQIGVENMSPLEIQGFIKSFELAVEMGWKTLQDYLQEQGYEVKGPNQSIKQAFKDELIVDHEWMRMLKHRNEVAHDYDDEKAAELAAVIASEYYPLFDALDKKMTAIKNALDA